MRRRIVLRIHAYIWEACKILPVWLACMSTRKPNKPPPPPPKKWTHHARLRHTVARNSHKSVRYSIDYVKWFQTWVNKPPPPLPQQSIRDVQRRNTHVQTGVVQNGAILFWMQMNPEGAWPPETTRTNIHTPEEIRTFQICTNVFIIIIHQGWRTPIWERQPFIPLPTTADDCWNGPKTLLRCPLNFVSFRVWGVILLVHCPHALSGRAVCCIVCPCPSWQARNANPRLGCCWSQLCLQRCNAISVITDLAHPNAES